MANDDERRANQQPLAANGVWCAGEEEWVEISRRVLRSKSFTAPPKDYQNYSLNYLARIPFCTLRHHRPKVSATRWREEGNLSEK